LSQVTCDGVEPGQYDGYQIELWKEIAADMNLNKSDWSFSCVNWDLMIEDLLDPNGSCTVGAAGGQL